MNDETIAEMVKNWLSAAGNGLIAQTPDELVSRIKGREQWIKGEIEWHPSYSPYVLWIMFVCFIRGHDWDYFSLTNLDGTPANFRCCLRCERSENLEV